MYCTDERSRKAIHVEVMVGLSGALADSASTSVVVGGSRGIGLALVSAILNRGRGRVIAASRKPEESASLRALQEQWPGRLHCLPCDVTDAASITTMANSVHAHVGSTSNVNLLLNVAGILHDPTTEMMPERSLASVDPTTCTRVMQINAIGPLLVTQALQRQLAKGAVIGNLSARVGSISDNRLGGWWSYRMSKAALNQATRNMANEMRRREIIAVALHPGTTDTDLSLPFQKNVRPEKLFSTEFTANALLDVLEGLRLEDSGEFFAYDGSRIEY